MTATTAVLDAGITTQQGGERWWHPSALHLQEGPAAAGQGDDVGEHGLLGTIRTCSLRRMMVGEKGEIGSVTASAWQDVSFNGAPPATALHSSVYGNACPLQTRRTPLLLLMQLKHLCHTSGALRSSCSLRAPGPWLHMSAWACRRPCLRPRPAPRFLLSTRTLPHTAEALLVPFLQSTKPAMPPAQKLRTGAFTAPCASVGAVRANVAATAACPCPSKTAADTCIGRAGRAALHITSLQATVRCP